MWLSEEPIYIRGYGGDGRGEEEEHSSSLVTLVLIVCVYTICFCNAYALTQPPSHQHDIFSSNS
jgi:hypothetical protein